MRNFLAASLLAVEAFLAASNLSCLLLSNKSIFYLLVLMIQLSCCTDYASEHNVSLLDFRKFAHKQPVLEPQSKVLTIIFRNRQNQIFNLVRTWFVLGSNLVRI